MSDNQTSKTQPDEELNDNEELNDKGEKYKLYRGDTFKRTRGVDGGSDIEEESDESDSEDESDSDDETLYTEDDEKIIEKLHMFEQMFETFLKPIITFFTKINYSNTFIQISIIVSIVYIISSIISMIHINVDYSR